MIHMRLNKVVDAASLCRVLWIGRSLALGYLDYTS